MSTTVTAEATTLADRIREAVSAKEVEMPPLPELLVRLEQLLADEDKASTKAVAELIAQDPAVTAGVLRIANSAAYGGLREIADVSQAVARIGLRQVRGFANAILHRANFESAEPSRVELVRSLWRHAMSTAVAARNLAEEVRGNAEESFLAGLLHDTGKLLVLRGVSHVESVFEEVEITPVVFDELMTALHADLGHLVLEGWHLPSAICDVARDHHAEEFDPENKTLLIVCVANAMSRRLGMHPYPDEDLDLMTLDAVERLGLDEVTLAMSMVDVQDELQELESLL